MYENEEKNVPLGDTRLVYLELDINLRIAKQVINNFLLMLIFKLCFDVIILEFRKNKYNIQHRIYIAEFLHFSSCLT